MSQTKNINVPQPRENEDALSAFKAALAVTYKALKAFSFYPEGHPLRERILLGAFQAMSAAAQDGMLSLVVHRNGFSFPDHNPGIDSSPLTKALAQELFARETQRLVILPDLSLAEFTTFLSLLTQDPLKITAAGGLAATLKLRGVQAMVLNEIDITAVFTRKKVEQATTEAATQTAASGSAPAPDATPVAGQDPGQESSQPGSGNLDQLSQLDCAELCDLMSRETDDNRYRQLARLLHVKALPLKLEKNFDRLFGVLLALLEQAEAPAKGPASRDQARYLLQQLASGEATEHLLDHLEDAEFKQKERVYQIFRAAGAEAVDPLVKRLIAVGLKPSRKALMTALLRVGPPAEPALLLLLQDGRWQVVLAAIAILAQMGSRDALQGLLVTAYHSDGRVRMESIRALAGIGGLEATTALIELLRDPNQAIALHAITWLGNTRNPRALQPLLHLIQKRDFLGKFQALKKEALLAVGRIGDRRALDPLFALVQKRFWILPRRWDELKLGALEAMGNLGGEPARVLLARVAAQGGELGRASAIQLEFLAARDSERE
jgi:hypothetical protein